MKGKFIVKWKMMIYNGKVTLKGIFHLTKWSVERNLSHLHKINTLTALQRNCFHFNCAVFWLFLIYRLQALLPLTALQVYTEAIKANEPSSFVGVININRIQGIKKLIGAYIIFLLFYVYISKIFFKFSPSTR